MRQFRNNLKRNRNRNNSDRSFKRNSDIDKLNGNFSNNDNSFRRKINRSNGNVQKLVGEQLQKQFDFFEQASAASGLDYKFLQRLEILDGGNGANTPNVLETWEIYGAYLTSVDYGGVAYANSDPVTVGLTIMYDNAVQTPIGNGVGATVARNVSVAATGGGT